jgi:hypothetical protein
MPVLLDALGVPLPDPRHQGEMRKLVGAAMIANAIKRPCVMFVTSARWGRIVAEMEAPDDPNAGIHFTWADPTKRFTRGQDRFNMGLLTVVNARTEDAEAVETANRLSVPDEFLRAKRSLVSGRARAPVMETEAL